MASKCQAVRSGSRACGSVPCWAMIDHHCAAVRCVRFRVFDSVESSMWSSCFRAANGNRSRRAAELRLKVSAYEATPHAPLKAARLADSSSGADVYTQVAFRTTLGIALGRLAYSRDALVPCSSVASDGVGVRFVVRSYGNRVSDACGYSEHETVAAAEAYGVHAGHVGQLLVVSSGRQFAFEQFLHCQTKLLPHPWRQSPSVPLEAACGFAEAVQARSATLH